LVSSIRKIVLSDGSITLYRGIFNRKKTYHTDDIDKIMLEVQEKNGDKTNSYEEDFMSADLEGLISSRYLTPYKIIIHPKKGKSFELNSFEYETEAFHTFCRELKSYVVEVGLTISERGKRLTNEIQVLIKTDKKLLIELDETIADSWESVFKPQTLKQYEAEILEQKEVIWVNKHPYGYTYYRSDQLLEDSSPESRDTALQLIQTSRSNKQIIQTRLNSYEQILDKANKLVRSYAQRDKLRKAAERLGALQQQNMTRKLGIEDLHRASFSFQQLESLTRYTSELNTEFESQKLSEHLKQFSETSIEEEALLQELNHEFLQTHVSDYQPAQDTDDIQKS